MPKQGWIKTKELTERAKELIDKKNMDLEEKKVLQKGKRVLVDVYFSKRMKRTWGRAYCSKREIVVSKEFYKKNDSETVDDLLLHELVHIEVGCSHGHDYTFRSRCLEVGIPAHTEGVEKPEPEYEIQCVDCENKFGRYKRPSWVPEDVEEGYVTSNRICANCRGDLKVVKTPSSEEEKSVYGENLEIDGQEIKFENEASCMECGQTPTRWCDSVGSFVCKECWNEVN